MYSLFLKIHTLLKKELQKYSIQVNSIKSSTAPSAPNAAENGWGVPWGQWCCIWSADTWQSLPWGRAMSCPPVPPELCPEDTPRWQTHQHHSGASQCKTQSSHSTASGQTGCSTLFVLLYFVGTMECPGHGCTARTAQKIGISSIPWNPGGESQSVNVITIKGRNKTSRKIKDLFFYLSKKYFCLSTERFCILFDFASLSADVLVSELEKKYYNYKFVNESLL